MQVRVPLGRVGVGRDGRQQHHQQHQQRQGQDAFTVSHMILLFPTEYKKRPETSVSGRRKHLS